MPPHLSRSLPALAAALAFALPAAAQSLADFERVDVNTDGAVSAEEFAAARRRDFDLLDANKDGFLSRLEFTQLRGADPSVARLRAHRFQELDTDRDGRIGRNEYLAHGRRQFAALDRDRDGRITRAEFEAALAGSLAPPSAERPLVRPAPDARVSTGDRPLREAFERIDRNRDGFITPAELDAARLASFQQMDADSDNRLSRQEIVAARGEAAGTRFEELDADKNGFVTPREFVDAGRAIFRSADVNADGKLTFEEFARTGTR